MPILQACLFQGFCVFSNSILVALEAVVQYEIAEE